MNHSSSPAPDSTAKSGDGTTARTWVSLRRLSKTFGPAQVLQEVDLDVRAAEIHGLVGQNGSGKSTVIKVLSGVHSADPGSAIEVNGVRLSNPVRPAELRHHGLAFVHQDLGLVDQCTVVENIPLGQFHVRAVSRRVDWSQERRAAEQTLDRLHTHLDTSRLVGTLTARERVVVAIDGGYDAPSGIFALQGAKTVTDRRFTYVTSTGQPPGVERVASGSQAADPGTDTDLAMWNTADALFPVLTHGQPVASYSPRVRIFTPANVPSSSSSSSAYASGTWYTDGKFKVMYQKLWGL